MVDEAACSEGGEEVELKGKERQKELSCSLESLWSICTNHSGFIPTPCQPLGRRPDLQEMTLWVPHLCAKWTSSLMGALEREASIMAESQFLGSPEELDREFILCVNVFFLKHPD